MSGADYATSFLALTGSKTHLFAAILACFRRIRDIRRPVRTRRNRWGRACRLPIPPRGCGTAQRL